MSTADLTVWLVHHGEALDPGVDSTRPLSASGRAAVERLAETLATRGVRPTAVWHSGKLRARHTAEVLWRACNPLSSFSAVRGLQPADPAEWIADRLAAEEGMVMLVGHMPHLSRLLRLLVSGDQEGRSEFPLHGAVCAERQHGRWREVWRSA